MSKRIIPNTNMMKRCLYCYKLKDESEFSKEHVIPQSIGGTFNKPDNPFVLHNVCERCNNVLGIYVDAPFTKSTLINMYRHQVAYEWVNPEKNKSIPLAYMGYNQQISYKDYICENYLGPTGDTIYHFHKQYPEEEVMTGVVGIPPTAKRKNPDKGFAFLFITSNNPIWLPTIILSFVDALKDSIHYLGNGPTPQINKGNFTDIPKKLNELHDELLKIQNTHHEQRLSLDILGEQRFMAKLGLSIGAALLNNNFIDSEDADLLRNFMREKDPEERKKIPIKGNGILGGKWNLMEKILSWKYGHTILLKEINGVLVFFIQYYGSLNTLIQISTDRSHWKGKIKKDGTIYVLIPEKQSFVGPLGFTQFLEHTQKITPIKELHSIEEEIQNYTCPPFKV